MTHTAFKSRISVLIMPVVLLGALIGCHGGGHTQLPPPDPPQVLSINPIGSLGLPGDIVEFTAETTGDIVAWEWRFPSFLTPATPFAANSQVELQRPGSGQVELIVQDANGEFARHEVPVSSTVPSFPGWAKAHTIPPTDPYSFYNLAMTLIEEIPFVAYFTQASGPPQSGPFTLRVTYPQENNPSTTTAWNDVEVLTGPSFSALRGMQLTTTADGRCTIGFGQGSTQVAIAIAESPTDSSDWRIIEVSANEGFGAITNYLGKLVVASVAFESTPFHKLLLRQASMETPVINGDFGPSFIADIGGSRLAGGGRIVSLAATDSQLGLAYANEPPGQFDPNTIVYWDQTSDATLTENSFRGVESRVEIARQFGAIEAHFIRDRPFILMRSGTPATEPPIRWSRVVHPTEQGDWIGLDPGLSHDSVLAVVISANRLAFVEHTENGPRVARALSVDPSDSAEFAIQMVDPSYVPGSGIPSALGAVALPDGRILIAAPAATEFGIYLSDGPW